MTVLIYIQKGKIMMAYSMEIIHKDEQNTSEWAGGTTTQLAIHPKNSEYKERTFSWRLSSARVDLEESVFTSLPGIFRHIMVLEGEMKLIHEGHHTALLRPFEKDSFSGSWMTKSIGKVRDFNLMLGNGCKGELEALLADEGIDLDTQAFACDKAFANVTQGFYCVDGNADILTGSGNRTRLTPGDLLLISYPSEEKCPDIRLEPCCEKTAAVVRAGILHK